MARAARPPEADSLFVIGVAGAVGSGKSAAASALERLGCARFDADASAKAALDTPAVIHTLRDWWGESIVDAEGRVDRARVAAIVFKDDEQRRRLERLVHPLVRQELAEAMRRAAAEGLRCMVLDIPLLFEGGLDAWCDAVLFVDTPRDTRLRLVDASRGWDDEELARRESAQVPEAEKRARSTLVVANDADLPTLTARVGEAFQRLTQAGTGRSDSSANPS